MRTIEPLEPLKTPYMERKPMKWGFFKLKEADRTLIFECEQKSKVKKEMRILKGIK